MLAVGLTRRSMPLVLCTHDRQLVLQLGRSIPIGRADVPKCPEAMFVSRQQCVLSLSPDGTQVDNTVQERHSVGIQ